MKQIFLKQATVAVVALLSIPALTFAQKEKPQDKDDKKDVQQIIITRKVDKDQKTVIEIKGDKVLVNGKDVSKDNDVSVRLNKIKTPNGVTYYRSNGNPDMNFEFNNNDFDGDNFMLLSEDANRAMLGVTTDEDDKGAKITAITRESAASKAGLKVGDIITKIGDAKVEDADDVAKAVREHKPGDKVTVSILRDGKAQTFTAELGKWKGVRINNLNATIAPMPPMGPNRTWAYDFNNGKKLGLSVQETEDGKGVKVLNVADDSNAAKAGIKKDDIITKINDDEVNTTDEVVEAMRDARDDSTVKLQVLRDGKTQTIEVRMPRDLKKADL